MPTWLRNPFSRGSSDPEQASDTEALPSGSPPAPAGSSSPPGLVSFPDAPRPSQDVAAILTHFKTPTRTLTGHQIFYIFVVDGLGAAVLSGGINFAIAYAMYSTQDTTLHPIRLWQLPNTLAGDAAVTIIVQSLITWFIELGLVGRDLRTGGVSPVGFLPRPRNTYLRRLFFLDEFSPPDSPSWTAALVFVIDNALRAVATAVVGFVLLWPISVGALTAFGRKEGGDWVYEKTWTPQVFKLVLGGVWGLLQTPVYAGFWLVREGWVRLGEEEVIAGGEGGEGGGEGVESGGEVAEGGGAVVVAEEG